MCIGQPQAPAPAPVAPTPLPVEKLTAKTASDVGRAGPKKSKKKSSFRRRKSGGTNVAAKALNLTPKKTS